MPLAGPVDVPWPCFSRGRTTREPPGSTGVASVTQAPLESGAAVGGRKAQGALFRSLPSGAGDPGRGAAGVPGW